MKKQFFLSIIFLFGSFFCDVLAVKKSTKVRINNQEEIIKDVVRAANAPVLSMVLTLNQAVEKFGIEDPRKTFEQSLKKQKKKRFFKACLCSLLTAVIPYFLYLFF